LYTHLCALGLRASEVVPLKVSDFKLDIEKPYIKIDRVMSQKNVIKNRVKNDDEERFVYIGKNLAERVKSFVIGKGANDWLFPSEKHVGKPRSHQAFVKHGIKRALKKIGKLDQWQGAVHVLRHYYASIIIEVAMKEKKSFKWIPKQLGHSQVSTTMEIYGHLVNPDDNDIGDVIEESLLG
jgi:integrase